jgi:hypothetical protein
MLARNAIALRVAALLLPVLLYATAAAALDAQAERKPTTSGRAEPSTLPQAPVGHRQPRASDIPKDASNAADEERQRRDRELDSRLQICRGC